MSNDGRRRLEPLRITPKQPGHETARVPEGGPSRGSAPVQGPSKAVVAATVLGLAVLAGAVAFIFRGTPGAVALGLPSPAISVTPSMPVPRVTQPMAEPGWTAMLHADSCPAPCSGGSACGVTTVNAAKGRCRAGSAQCDACISGVSCIPGEPTALFTGEESWRFYLSAVAERGSEGSAVDPCTIQRDLWLCIRSRSKVEASCVSQVEACQNGARGTTAIPITSDDLISSGFDLEIREGGPGGAILATKVGAKYADGVRRTSLCGGLKVTFPDSIPVAYVTYFLDASSAAAVSVP